MLLYGSHPVFLEHDTGRGHPERADRLRAVEAGVRLSGLADVLGRVEARPATREELERVHIPSYLDALERFVAQGGGHLDPDTVASGRSWEAALLAAGLGLAAVEAIDTGRGGPVFLAVRPPGHHATADRAMGFCLLNNVAVVAAALLVRGERVAILDWDAHHGNGTQDIFWTEPGVLYVSWHQWPLYPGTGAWYERGEGDGEGTTLNIPLPPAATGDVYLAAFDEVVAPVVDAFGPEWVLVSCGFDAHRSDTLTSLSLSAGDYAALAERAVALAPRRERVIVFLEGGYDLVAIERCVAATLTALAEGVETMYPEPPTSGGPGAEAVERARSIL